MILGWGLRNLANFASGKHTIAIVRHGENIWTKERKWVGWTDVPLSSFGIKEMKQCAETLKSKNIAFDAVYTSLLSRAIKSTNYILDELNMHHLPVHKEWRLNEKHYGKLQGVSKVEANQKYGEKVVTDWRRGFNVLPPALDKQDSNHPVNDPRYKHVDPSLLPSSESLKDIIERLSPLWKQSISKQLKSGKNLLVVAHGSSLRALVSLLSNNLSQDQINNFDIPSAIPIILTLDENLKITNIQYLADQHEIDVKMAKLKTETQRKEV